LHLWVQSLAVSGTDIFAGTADAGVFITTDNGVNWSQTGLYYVGHVYCLAVSGQNIFAGTSSNGVYVTTNNGQNWTQTSLNNVEVGALAISGTNVFAGTLHNGYGNVYLSTNNGLNWTETSLSLNGYCIGPFAVCGSYLFAGGGDSVYVTTNNGLNWALVGLNGPVNSFVISGLNIFAGMGGGGVKLTTNNGINWTAVNEGFPISPSLFSLGKNASYIFAGLLDNVWRRPLSELIGIKQIGSEVPTAYRLFQNYPNPFNPTTKIKFQIPPSPVTGEGRSTTPSVVRLVEGDVVKLIIYDLLGRDVATLVNDKMKPRTYEVVFDGSNYSSGIYFYKLSSSGGTESFSETKCMVLIK
jgi:hypothetical protein